MVWSAFSQQSNSISYTIKNGLPSNTVYCVVQDDQGFIWFGTEAGLSRFDGVEFKNYGLQEGLPDMDILNFHKDSQGRIWFYTFNGRVGFLENGKIYNSGNSRILRSADFNSRITSIVDSNSKVYLSSLQDGFKVIDSTGRTDSIKPEGFSYYLTKMHDECYWVIVDDYKFQYSFIKVDELVGKDLKVGLKHEVQGGIHLSYIESVDCNIYTSAHSMHGYVYEINTAKKSLRRQSLDFKIYNLDEVDGQVFLFTNVGIKALDKEGLTATDFVNVKESTFSILDSEGNRWVTTLDNGVVFFPKSEVVTHDEGISINGLEAPMDSVLYLVHSDYKFGYLDQDEIVNLFDHPRFYLKTMYVDKLRNVWALTSTGLIKNGFFYKEYKATNTSFLKEYSFIFHVPGSLKYVHLLDGYEVDLPYQNLGKIWDFEFVEKDKILVASARGLFLLDLSTKVVSSYEAFSRLQITGMSLDKFGYIWFATNGYSLLRVHIDLIDELKSHQLKNFRVSDYSDVYGKTLLVDSIVYASCPKGVGKFYFNSSGIVQVSHISESNGLHPSRVNDLQFFQNRVYIAQDNGLFSFDHGRNFEENIDFPVIIDEVIAGDSAYAKSDNSLSFPYNIGTIQVNTKAIYFKDHENLSYQFRLFEKGEVDPTWSASPSNTFIFSKLSPGMYTFQVRVRSINSKWSTPKTLDFQIENIFWRTPWFIIFVSGLLLMAIYLVYLSVSRSKRNKQLLLREKIESDLKALKAQINPHFLFNSINSIQSFFLEGDNEVAESYLIKYAKLIRTILNHSDSPTVLIYEEIEAMKLYVELEKLRLSKPLDFQVSIDSNIDIYTEKIPSMIIQPIIENSIWHGIQPSDKDGQIHLKFILQSNQILVIVEDNGVGITNGKSQTNNKPHGIQLIKERINLINKLQKVESKFEISSNALGAKVIFSYPAYSSLEYD